MSGRLSFAIAVLLLLFAVVLRFWDLTLLPPGLSSTELVDVRQAEQARTGRVAVFNDRGDGTGHEGLYPAVLAAVTTFTGRGLLGYHVFSAWVGMLALAMIYALGTRLFGRLAGLGALALMAFTFYPLLLSRQVSREMLLPLFITSALLCLAVALPVYRRRRRRGANTTLFAALGVMMGIVLYVHPVGLLVVLVGSVFIAYVVTFQRQRISRRRVRYITFALLLTIITAMPYVTSSIQLTNLSGAQRLFTDVGLSLDNAIRSIGGIAIRGDQNAVHNIPGQPLLGPVSALIVLVGLLAMIYDRRKPTHALLAIALVILAPTALLAEDAPDFSAFAALLPLIALLFGLGLDTLSDLCLRYARPLARPLTLVGFASIALLNGLLTTNHLFATWAALPAVQTAYQARLAYLAHYLDQSVTRLPTVVCSRNVLETLDEETRLLLAMMSKRRAPVRFVDCSSGLVMTEGGATQQIILPTDSELANAHWQIREWLLRGEWLEDDAIPAQSILMMDVEERLADTIGRFIALTPVSYAPETSSPSRGSQAQIPVTFGGNLTFLGYATENTSEYPPGSIVTVITYWRVDGVVPPDLVLFTHIQADPAAQPVAQTDTISVRPTQLENRDVFVQVTYIPLPENIPTGEYQISVGAYQDESDVRLDVLQDGMPRGSRVFLYNIVVSE